MQLKKTERILFLIIVFNQTGQLTEDLTSIVCTILWRDFRIVSPTSPLNRRDDPALIPTILLRIIIMTTVMISFVLTSIFMLCSEISQTQECGFQINQSCLKTRTSGNKIMYEDQQEELNTIGISDCGNIKALFSCFVWL